jgi:predicted nucleotidyltransferase
MKEMAQLEMQIDTRRKYRKLDPEVLKYIVDSVVELAHPEKIILFGSAARGQMGPNSDVVLLVIKSGHFHRGRLIDKIYMGLDDADEPVDIVIATPEEVERYGDCPYFVIYPALREGKVVYVAKAPTPGRRSK